MALFVAPYNTAMRIGQGFNSYTHEICVNDAVVFDDSKPGGDHYAADSTKVSQVVTYCTRYVDKLSQVTDAMSVSAALSIKTAAAGGGASGSYVDSDKFKESNINFFVQVKVTNQVIMAEDVTKFQSIPGINSASEFTRIFGDCFISGFVEGGELDAIISIKCSGTSSDKDIKAALEANFGKGGVGGSLSGSFAMSHAKALSDSETTITVNWSGGGNIKPKDQLWSIESLTQAAAAFPENVAGCPQRVYAILTKYDKLRSFQLQETRLSPLTYENATLYTNDLLDAYMDYRNLWKKIHTMTVAFEFGEVNLTKSNWLEKQERRKVKQADPMSALEEVVSYVEGSSDQSHVEHMKTILAKMKQTDYRDLDGEVYEPTFAGLQKARKDCRVEMLKIVKEVDVINNDPNLALDQDRDAGYINPAIFRKLLPIDEEKKKKPASENGQKQLPAPAPGFYTSEKALHPDVETWIKTLKPEQTKGFSMSEYAGDHSGHKAGDFGHMFESIGHASVINKVEVWTEQHHISGLKIAFKGNTPQPLSLGKVASNPTESWDVPSGSKITALNLHAGKFDYGETPVVYGLKLSTDILESKYFGTTDKGEKDPETVKLRAPRENWSLKGFWAQTGAGFDRLGVFWGED